MADEPTGPDSSTEDQGAPPQRVRRRRSSRSRSRSRTVQTRVPFTSLRFARPRMPSPASLLLMAVTVLAIGVGAESLIVSNAARARLDHLQATMTSSVQSAAAGQQAAEALAAQSRAYAAQQLAAQDAAHAGPSRLPVAPPPVGVDAPEPPPPGFADPETTGTLSTPGASADTRTSAAANSAGYTLPPTTLPTDPR